MSIIAHVAPFHTSNSQSVEVRGGVNSETTCEFNTPQIQMNKLQLALLLVYLCKLMS